MKETKNTQHLDQLIKKCQRQQRQAQSELYRLYFKQLANAALRYSRDNAEAKDVVHDAFLKIFTKINQFISHSERFFNPLILQ